MATATGFILTKVCKNELELTLFPRNCPPRQGLAEDGGAATSATWCLAWEGRKSSGCNGDPSARPETDQCAPAAAHQHLIGGKALIWQGHPNNLEGPERLRDQFYFSFPTNSELKGHPGDGFCGTTQKLTVHRGCVLPPGPTGDDKNKKATFEGRCHSGLVV